MFLYLLLIAAVVASSETPPIEPELQEIITLFTSEDNINTTLAPSIPTPEITASAEQPAPITITNAIEPSMLAYKHWTGTYSPEKFTLQVNGVEIAHGEHYTISAADTTVEIRYDYSFMNGMRTGAKKVSYQLNENITQANITFSWKDSWKVLVDNGTAIQQEEIIL